MQNPARAFAIAALCLVTTGPLRAEVVSMSFGGATPPYAIAETETGIEVDVIREALAYRGHTLEPVFVPAGRLAQMLLAGQVDATSRDQGVSLDPVAYFYAMKAVFLFDVMFTLSERNLEIVQPVDLDGLSVVAFANAAKIYPDWLAASVSKGLYREVADQNRQVKMLDAGRADVIVADRYIIRYLSRELERTQGVVLKPTRMTLFSAPWGFAPVFRSERIRDDFNAGFQVVRESGRYDEIIGHYLD